ncbi:MAG: hypothetical protein DDT26_00009 [Dehalococcoidia bacterium]|nr:hypothetical protein [Chloroflexota bacterium]
MTSNPHKRVSRIFRYAIAIALVVWALHLSGGPSAEALDQKLYCDMVRLNHKDPTAGWPDYLRTYKQECYHE